MFKKLVLGTPRYNIKYSQNYLSLKVAKSLVNSLDLDKTIPLIEIGAGKGSITKRLEDNGFNITAIELDQENSKFLRETLSNKTQVINIDFLKHRLPSSKYNVIGNIPFAKSSEIIRKILLDKNPPLKSYLIVQKEFALRLKSNDFFALQFKPWFEIKIIKSINRFEIKPVPNVDIVLVEIKKRELPVVSDKESYLDFLAYCFSTRKDNMQKILNKAFSFNQLRIIQKDYFINLKSSPRQLIFEQWLGIFKTFEKYVNVSKKNWIHGSYKKLTNQQKKLNKRTKTNISYNY
jgi:23S rRNA (adenine-N6)-dimethyltransferase